MRGTFNYGDFQCMDCEKHQTKVIHYSKEIILCFDCYRIREKQEVNCCNCKFYDGYLCELNYRSKAILDEVKTAKECKYFTPGAFINSDDHLLVDID